MKYLKSPIFYMGNKYGDCRKIVADYYIDDRNVLLVDYKDILEV